MTAFCLIAAFWAIYEMAFSKPNPKNPQRGELMFPEDK